MAVAYPQELRDAVLRMYEQGYTTKQISVALNVSPAWCRMLKQRLRESGERTARPRGGRRVRVVKIDMEALARLIEQTPDATLEELREKLGITCSLSAIHYAIGRLDLTYKKNARRLGAGPS